MTMTTSVEAHAAIKPHLNALQQRVLDLFIKAGGYGMTSEELYTHFPGTKESTSRTRISELVRLGLVKATGWRVRSNSGRRMTVWIRVPR